MYWNLEFLYNVQAYPSGRAVQVRVWSLSLTGIWGSNPAGSMDVCLNVVCCQVEVSATSRALVRSPTECSVSECGLETSTMRRLRHNRAVIYIYNGKALLLSFYQSPWNCSLNGHTDHPRISSGAMKTDREKRSTQKTATIFTTHHTNCVPMTWPQSALLPSWP